MKNKTRNEYLNKLSRNYYSGADNICSLNEACVFSDKPCSACVLASEMSKAEFIRITENRTKVVTWQEVQESIDILVLMG